MKHEAPPETAAEHPLDLTLSKVRSLVNNMPGKELWVRAAAILAFGKIKMHKLPRGIEVGVGKIRGVREAKAVSKSKFIGLLIEGRVAGRSRSHEQTEPYRSGEVTEGMVWVTGFAKPASWEIHMPAQECFEAVSVHVPLDFLDAMMATEPELARRGKRMVEESTHELGVASRKQRSLFLKMLQIDADQPGGKLLLESCALELLAETLSPLPDNLTAGNAQISEIVQNVTELVDLKLANPPTVADLAGTLRISESRLKREFIDRTGTSIGAFMTGRRMAAAKDMVSSGLPISRVAAEVGYATPEAFSKAFRRKFGSSPREFRANSR